MCPKFSYADQNLIIKCRDSLELQEIVAKAQQLDVASLVLSPMHFYEIGTVRERKYEETIVFIEKVHPTWILSRADLLLRELASEWNKFWKLKPLDFNAIGDLANAASAMHRKPAALFAGLTPRDFIKPFRDEAEMKRIEGQFQELRAVFDANMAANDVNRTRYKAGQLTPAMLREVERRYVATQLARIHEEGPNIADLYKRANQILEDPELSQRISIFVENGGTQRLKAHVIENLMTLDSWKREAILKENRQVDREHAIVALAYCDEFVTGDSELRKYCKRIRTSAGFQLAEVVSADEWVERLRNV